MSYFSDVVKYILTGKPGDPIPMERVAVGGGHRSGKSNATEMAMQALASEADAEATARMNAVLEPFPFGLRFNWHGTKTGRFNSSHPNRANVPRSIDESPTGRAPSEPEMQTLDEVPPTEFDKSVINSMRAIDFATLEIKMTTAEVENAVLNEWVKGTLPGVKVRVLQYDGGFVVKFGEYGTRYMTFEDLTAIGYRFETEHKRDYFDQGDDVVKRLRPGQVPYEIAGGSMFIYRKRIQQQAFNVTPLETGGETVVRVYAPSGHWAEGVSVCSIDDAFDKHIGRTLATTDALNQLNLVVNGK